MKLRCLFLLMAFGLMAASFSAKQQPPPAG